MGRDSSGEPAPGPRSVPAGGACSRAHLVFGLGARTNRAKHDEYAKRRMRQQSSAQNEPLPDGAASPVTVPAQETADRASIAAGQPASNKSSEPSGGERAARPRGASPSRIATSTFPGGYAHTKDAGQQERMSADPLARGALARSSPAVDSAATAEAARRGQEQPDKSARDGPETGAAARMQFNIPPPPLVQTVPGKSRLVSHAKSRIYERQLPTAAGHSAVSLSSSAAPVPDAIQSGFKPPMQVSVSKARERWEGGEPFAKCKSRQRLQAAESSKWVELRSVSNSAASPAAAASLGYQKAAAATSRLAPDQAFAQSASQPNNRVKVLTRGSVLERVQKFERVPAPEADAPPPQKQASAPVAGARDQQAPAALDAAATRSLIPLRRRSSAGSAERASYIPKFYHPNGRLNTYELELQKKNILACFDRLPERKAQLNGPTGRRHFQSIALACGLSQYFGEPLLLYVKHQLTNSSLFHGGQAGSRRTTTTTTTTTTGEARQRAGGKPFGLVKAASIDNSTVERLKSQTALSCEQFLTCWRQLCGSAHDTAAQFVHLLSLGQRSYLVPDDFVPLVQSVIDDHPGLEFLRAAPDFHMRYIQTVIARLYYSINRSWTGKMSVAELRASNLFEVLRSLAKEVDINQVTEYFSYEHFYVIYCKFWSLDQDHDLLISKQDLARHNDAAISSRIIERIFLGIVSRDIRRTGKMSYSDFVWFLMAEEDKKHPRAIEYWFRLMDIDGDGYISMYEMEYFYYEQVKRLELMSIEALPFVDNACQILDLVNPKEPNKISLSDLKRTQMAPIFFDTFINLEKYLEHESREFISSRSLVIDGKVVSEWHRYASEEYAVLISEESGV